jgi:hypothetical protein
MYNKVKYMKKMYQKNLIAVHSKPIMEYTITPYIRAWTKVYGISIITCMEKKMLRRGSLTVEFPRISKQAKSC